ncbi:6069_t:CDS:2, partial [Gigaspora margarita]
LNNLDALTSIQKILIVCKSISEIDTILKFVHNFGNNQIKELISNIQQKQKIATIEYYLVQKSGNPRWFFNGLDRLSQYLQEILAFPLLDPFCRFKTECFELNPNQADDVISAIDQAYNDYQLSNKPSRIEINSFNQDQKICVEIILQKWQ